VPGEAEQGRHQGEGGGHDGDDDDGRGEAEGRVGAEVGQAQAHQRHQHGGAGEDHRAPGRRGRAGGRLPGAVTGGQELDVARGEQQGVVDADPEPDHGGDRRGAGAHVGHGGQQQHAGRPEPEPDEGHEDRHAGGHDRAEGEHEQDQRDGDPHQLARAAELHGVLRDLPAELDLQPRRARRLHGLLERLEVAHEVGVGDGLGVADVEQHGGAVGRRPRWGHVHDVRHVREPAAQGLHGGRVDGAGGIVDHHAVGGPRGGGEVLAQQLRARLRARAGDVPVVAGACRRQPARARRRRRW
jgi:hypothetical protein